jgi:hypothetical protein
MVSGPIFTSRPLTGPAPDPPSRHDTAGAPASPPRSASTVAGPPQPASASTKIATEHLIATHYTTAKPSVPPPDPVVRGD